MSTMNTSTHNIDMSTKNDSRTEGVTLEPWTIDVAEATEGVKKSVHRFLQEENMFAKKAAAWGSMIGKCATGGDYTTEGKDEPEDMKETNEYIIRELREIASLYPEDEGGDNASRYKNWPMSGEAKKEVFSAWEGTALRSIKCKNYLKDSESPRKATCASEGNARSAASSGFFQTIEHADAELSDGRMPHWASEAGYANGTYYEPEIETNAPSNSASHPPMTITF